MFLTSVAILPFILGRNLLEVELLGRNEIFGFSIYDVKYFFPVYLADIFLLLVFQNYLSGKISKRKEFIPFSKTKSKISVLLLLMLLIVSTKGLIHQFSFLSFSGFLIFKYFLFFIVISILNKKDIFKNLKYLLMASLLFQSLIILLEQFKGGNIGRFIENTSIHDLGTVSMETVSLLRANGTFNEANVAATFLLMGFVIIFPLMLSSLKKKRFHYSIIVCLFSIVAIIFTGSRSLYFLTLIYLVWQFFENKELFRLFLIDLLKNRNLKIIIIVIGLVFTPYLWQRIKTLPDTINYGGSLSYRRELNRHVLLLAREKPLFGIGLDMTPYYLAKTFKTIDSTPVIFDQAPAHNILIQLIAEIGLIGFLSFFIMILLFMKKIFSANNWKENSFFISSLVFLLAAQFHPVFSNHSELSSFFFLFMGIALEISESKKGENDKK